MRVIYLVAVGLHVVALAAWLGGMLTLAVVLVPALRRPALRSAGRELLWEAGVRLRVVAWIALATLLATGTIQLVYRLGGIRALVDRDVWASAWGHALATKLAIFAIILALAAWHDFRIGPRFTALARERPDSPEAERVRRAAGRIGRANLALTAAALALGVVLSRGVG